MVFAFFFFFLASRNESNPLFPISISRESAANARRLDALQSRLENVRKAERQNFVPLCCALPPLPEDRAMTGVKITRERDVRMHQMRIACTGRS